MYLADTNAISELRMPWQRMVKAIMSNVSSAFNESQKSAKASRRG
jgi:hypothetical protein